MSRSSYLLTNESTASNNRCFHHNNLVATNRIDENVSVPRIVVQSSNQSIVRLNPKTKRNLRDKRRPTGIRPDDVPMVNSATEISNNDDDDDKSVDPASASMLPANQFTLSIDLRPSFEKVSIAGRSDPHAVIQIPSSSTTYSHSMNNSHFRNDEFLSRRPATSDEDKIEQSRQLEQRLAMLEALLYDKDAIIHDLQRKLDQKIRDLSDAEQQIYTLHKDKLTLIKAFSSLPENKTSSRTDRV